MSRLCVRLTGSFAGCAPAPNPAAFLSAAARWRVADIGIDDDRKIASTALLQVDSNAQTIGLWHIAAARLAVKLDLAGQRIVKAAINRI